MWNQLIDHPESFKETFSTAMFGFAFSVGVNSGLLDEESYGKATVNAWNALTQYIDEYWKVSDVCIGTG